MLKTKRQSEVQGGFFSDQSCRILQSWTDEFLVWNPEDFDEVKQVSMPTANVWVPDILINEL